MYKQEEMGRRQGRRKKEISAAWISIQFYPGDQNDIAKGQSMVVLCTLQIRSKVCSYLTGKNAIN